MENHHGLSDALLGTGPIQEYVHRLSQNLWLLSCGSAAEVGFTMLGSDRMRSRLTELRAAFDYILIDAAALNTSNDAVVLGGRVDVESKFIPPRDRSKSGARTPSCECPHSGGGSEPAHVSHPRSTLQTVVSKNQLPTHIARIAVARAESSTQ
jgi:hypothetical protein